MMVNSGDLDEMPNAVPSHLGSLPMPHLGGVSS